MDMTPRRILLSLIAAVLHVSCTGVLLPCPAHARPRGTLTVALYPYVPEARDLFSELAAAFAATHPEVKVELVERYTEAHSHEVRVLADDYYDGGLLKTEADIYEIDTVLLAEMVRAGKISPIDLPRRDFLPEARTAIQLDDKTWGIPHWVCGNFLFYGRDDAAIARARTWQELIAALQDGGSVLADFTGETTLAEWYLTSLAAVDGDLATVARRLRSPDLFPPAVDALRRLLQFCPEDACRSEELHHRPGAHARLFARGQARAYIGYSETLHDGLQEIQQNCRPDDGCRTPDQIAVRALPTITPHGRPVGWVDALAVSAKLKDEKRQLAQEFVEFATSWDAYALVLNPPGAAAPRYLLPALAVSHAQPGLEPPLYTDFFEAFGARLIVTAEGLRGRLHEHAKALARRLAPARRFAERVVSSER